MYQKMRIDMDTVMDMAIPSAAALLPLVVSDMVTPLVDLVRPAVSGMAIPSADLVRPAVSGMAIPSVVSAPPAASGMDIPSVDLVIFPMAIPMADIWVILIAGYILADLILDLAQMDTAVPMQHFISLIIRDPMIS